MTADTPAPAEPTMEQIRAFNDRSWQAAKAFGEAHGFGFMIQVASEEWVLSGSHTNGMMAGWLRAMANDFAKRARAEGR